MHAALETLPAHWEVRPSRDGRVISCNRISLSPAGGWSEPGPRAESDGVMARRAEAYHGTAEGSPGRVDAEKWEQTARESLRAERRRYGPPMPRMPIDAVYTWVDGTDPAWRARRDAAHA